VANDLWHDLPKDTRVSLGQIQARLTGARCGAGGNHHNVSASAIGIVAHMHVYRPHKGQAVSQIHGFALGLGTVNVN
jgi:hypothetical protein